MNQPATAIGNITIRQATLAEIVPLRHVVLRAGLPMETAIFPGDELPNSRHYCAFADVVVNHPAVTCATFHLNEWQGEPAWQLRGMATAEGFRGRGLGRRVLEFADSDLATCVDAPSLFWCNARVPAVRFYEKLGWEVVSEVFEVPTAGPHVKMLRRLLW